MSVAYQPHRLNLYQKPKQGNGYIDRFLTYNYKHRVSAVGGFDSASCDIVPRSKASPERFVDQFLGNRVAIYVDSPVEPIWEGFIYRLTFNMGNSAFTISLDEMMNQVNVKYMPLGGTLTSVTPTATSKALASQAIYGIKAGTLDIGYVRATGTRVATLASTKLEQLAWPKQSSTNRSGAVPGTIHIEMLGFYHTLRWQERNQPSTNLFTLTNMFTNASFGLLATVANGTTFFDNTDTSLIATNTVTMPLDEFRGKTYWDVMVEIQETGDVGTNYYVTGITPTDFYTGTRRAYYQVANSSILYTARMRDGLRLRDIGGRLIAPWRARPDCGVLVSDWIIGGAISGDDPRETYIMNIDYDANSQQVVWTGDDALNGEAAFQLHRNTKPFGKRFGAPPYRTSTA